LKNKKKIPKYFSKFFFLKDCKFSACNRKPKQPNMPQQNVNSLPSVGRFVGEIGQKTAKTATIFKPISPTLDFF